MRLRRCPLRRPVRVLASLALGVGHWVQEAYCAAGQRVVERLEQVADAVAERRYLAEHPGWRPQPSRPPQPAVEIPVHPVVNGHKYLH